MSYEAVSERFRGIYRSLSQWVSGFPKFRRVALNWQAVGHFMQDGSYSQDLYPWVGYDKKTLNASKNCYYCIASGSLYTNVSSKLCWSVLTLTRKLYSDICLRVSPLLNPTQVRR
jgi:hypothetical protein